MEKPIIRGVCKLHGEEAELKTSHIFSAFLYRDFVGDQKRGGMTLIFSGNEKPGTRQITRPYLCDYCEGKLSTSEDIVKKLLKRIVGQQDKAHKYDEHLLRFCVSILWRLMIYGHEDLTVAKSRPDIPLAPYGKTFSTIR